MEQFSLVALIPINIKMSVKKQAFFNLIGRLFEFIITIGTPMVLVRLFTQTNYGHYQQAIVIGATVATLLRFNISQNLFYFFPRSKDKEEKSIFLSHTYFTLFAIGIVFFASMFLLKPLILRYVESYYLESIFMFFPVFVFFTILNRSFDNIFVIEGKAKTAMYYYSANRLIRGTLVIGAALVYKTPIAALWGIVVYLAIVAVFFYVYLLYNYRISPFKFDMTLFKRQANYSLPFGLSGIVGAIGNYADKVIITTILPAKDLAIYSVGNFKLPFIELLYTSVGNVILPQISKYSKLPDGKEKAYRLWRKMVVKNIIVTIPVLVFSIAYAVPIITFLFGEQYAVSANVFRILILIFIIQMFAFGYILRGFGITKPLLPANLVKMVLSVVLGIGFTYLFGYIGAAISFVIAFSSNGIIQLAVTKRFLKMSWQNFIPWRDILKILSVSLCCLLLSITISYLNITTFISLVVSSLIYFSVLYFFLHKMRYLPSPAKVKSLIIEYLT